jgi:methionyl-tRNA formyltransferase
MSGARYTGITLQTLDEKSFDNGIILAQTPPNGLGLPFESKCTYEQLLNHVKPVAVALLVQGLRDRVFVPPHIDVGWLKNKKPHRLVHAAKITSADKWVNWREHSPTTIERRFRALGRLWSLIHLDPETKKRIVFEDMEVVPKPEPIMNWLKKFQQKRHGPVKPTDEEKETIHFAVIADGGYMKPRFYVVDGDTIIVGCQNEALRIRKITVEGKGKQDAATVMAGFKDWEKWNIRRVNWYVNVVPKGMDVSKVKWKSEEPIFNARPDRGVDMRAKRKVDEGMSDVANKGIIEKAE